MYQFKDHLGNIRLSYKDADKNGSVVQSEIVQEKNYYPFGLEHEGYNVAITSTNQALKYSYNGKEINEELGINWYDYHARMYDPSIGRMLNIDPHSDSYYGINSYNYTLNNPVLLIDPDGKDSVISIQDGVITVSTQIYIYGSGANQKEANKIEKAIQSMFGDHNEFKFTDEEGNEFDVKFETNVELYDEENTELSEGDNLIEVRDEVGVSSVSNFTGDTGTWYSKETIAGESYAAYPHEFAHLLGLKDRYSIFTQLPDDGWENNFMGDATTMNVEQRNIDGIVKGAIKKYNRYREQYGERKASEKPYKYVKNAYLNRFRGN